MRHLPAAIRQREELTSSPARSPPARRVKTEVKEEVKEEQSNTVQVPEPDPTERMCKEPRCAACDVLSINGPLQCLECMRKNSQKNRLPAHASSYSTHWSEAHDTPDLYILEDDNYWKRHSEEHRTASVSGSFSFVRDADGNVVDITELETPTVSKQGIISREQLASRSDYRRSTKGP